MKSRARLKTARKTGSMPSIATIDAMEVERDERKKRGRLCAHFRRRRNPCRGCWCFGPYDTVAVLIAVPLFLFVYTNIESRVTDPFLEAQLNWPLLSWQVSRQFAPSTQRNFTMNGANSFVVNLPKDTERMKRFRELNGEQAAARIQVALAHQWIPDTKESQLTEKKHVLDMQRMYEQRYPYLLRMSRTGRYGSAGCSFSHIQVLETFVDSTDAEGDASYIFVFEDDAQLLEPLRSTGVVTAPQDADVVFLLDTSTYRVRVPYQGDTEGLFAIRVIDGTGAVGYVLTKNGAEKVLSYMRRETDPETDPDAIDLALLHTPGLKVYHPSSTWPQVVHRPGRQGSVRQAVDRNVQY